MKIKNSKIKIFETSTYQYEVFQASKLPNKSDGGI